MTVRTDLAVQQLLESVYIWFSLIIKMLIVGLWVISQLYYVNTIEYHYPYTVKQALVTTSIKQKLVLCDRNFYFPSQCISYQYNLY